MHVNENIRTEVLNRLHELELKYDIKVIHAIESGSRAWGFSSADSDYDVRFIYMHKPEWYWSIQDEFVDVESRGAINVPIYDDLDIAGWDLKKTLGLLYKSNPPLLEWLRSPIVYRSDQEISQELRQLSENFYSAKSCVYHYLHMAEGNLRQYLLNRDEVKRKKYLYVIRPILACRWIEQFGGFPPMEIEKTLITLEGYLILNTINSLIADKKRGTELGTGSADKVLEAFLVEEIGRLKKSVAILPENNQSIIDLNEYFRRTLKKNFM